MMIFYLWLTYKRCAVINDSCDYRDAGNCNNDEKNPFDCLPDEVICNILSSVPPTDLLKNVSAVSKRFCRVVGCEMLWRDVRVDVDSFTSADEFMHFISKLSVLKSLKIIINGNILNASKDVVHTISRFRHLSHLHVKIQLPLSELAAKFMWDSFCTVRGLTHFRVTNYEDLFYSRDTFTTSTIESCSETLQAVAINNTELNTLYTDIRRALVSCKKLKKLSIPVLSLDILASLPNVTDIDLHIYSSIDSDTLSAFSKKLLKMEKFVSILSLKIYDESYNERNDFSTLLNLVGVMCPSVNYLEIRDGAWQLGAMLELTDKLKNLSHLNIESKSFTVLLLKYLLSRKHPLRELHGTVSVTDDDVEIARRLLLDAWQSRLIKVQITVFNYDSMTCPF